MLRKLNQYAALINMILLALLAIGYYFGKDRVRIDNAIAGIENLKTEVTGVRELLIQHISKDK